MANEDRSLEVNGKLARLLEENGTKFMKDINKAEIRRRRGYNLPHWTMEGMVYHVRFRLHDSIPARMQQELAYEKELLLARFEKGDGKLTRSEKRRLINHYTGRVEKIPDMGFGECHLRNEPLADLVANALRYFQDKRYNLFAWAVMPNHVHCAVQPIGGIKLPQILHSWKSYTSNKINEYLGRTGTFWQREYFDHIIRSEEQLAECIEYVYMNPEKAGLKNWPWRYKAV